MTEQQQQIKSERFGSRWLHAHPSEDDVRGWFATQPLHEGMDASRYLGGIVLISATEKAKITMTGQQGPYVREVDQVVFVPYMKVDTRIAYFWDLVRLLNGERPLDENVKPNLADSMFGEFYGTIRAKPQPVITNEASAYFNAHLPEGYGIYPVRQNETTVSRYLVATFEAAIWKRGEKGEQDKIVLRGSGSKQVAMKRNYPDDNAIMKAETGAIGRALGVAGILVVGTGVATAEDMQEQMASGSTGAAVGGADGAQLPADAPTSEPQLGGDMGPAGITADSMADKLPESDDELRTMALELRAQMESGFPEAWTAYTEWWAARFPEQSLNDLTGPALRGAVVKLERDLDAARNPPA